MNQPNDVNPLFEPKLSPDDARLLEALVEAGFDPQAMEALSPADQRRTQTLRATLEHDPAVGARERTLRRGRLPAGRPPAHAR